MLRNRTLPKLVAAGFVVAVLSPPQATSAAQATCHGQAATIVSAGAQVVGTQGDDVIVADAQRVKALGGDDIVCVIGRFPSNEDGGVDLGPGDDLLDDSGVTWGEYVVTLGPGADTLIGGSQVNESVAADNESATDPDIDYIDTGGGEDSVGYTRGEVESHDTVLLGSGYDEIVVGPQAIAGTVDLGDGANRLTLLSGPADSGARWVVDATIGQVSVDGIDRLFWAGRVRDFELPVREAKRLDFTGTELREEVTVYGVRWLKADIHLGAGDDRLVTPLLRDRSSIDGDSGRDAFVMPPEQQSYYRPLDSIMLDLGRKRVRLIEGSRDAVSRLTGFEKASLDGAKLLVLRGSAAADELGWGRADHAAVYGLGGPDKLRHVTSNSITSSIVRGGRGDDLITGGRDTAPDTMLGGLGDDTLRGGLGNDTARGGPGTDSCAAEVVRDCETLLGS